MRTRAFTKKIFSFFLIAFMVIVVNDQSLAQCTSSYYITNPNCNPITVYDSSTVASGDTIDYINLDWGDGTATYNLEPNDFPVTHTYGSTGTYTYEHFIATTQGCTNSSSSVLTIGVSPIADFTTSPVCLGYPNLFTDISSSNGGSSLTSWYWDFGDPSSGSANYSTLQHPAHIYTASGTYTACLTVTNADGCTGTVCYPVEVYPNPVANFADSNMCTYDVYFTDLSIANALSIVSWNWDFDDGGTSTLQNPIHTYAGAGSYNVCLIVVNNNGCIDSTCSTVIIDNSAGGAGLTADFIAPDSSCDGSVIQFTDASTTCNASIIAWDWDFGDGNTGTGQNVTHTYLSPGMYSVTLLVTADSAGITITDDVTHPITIYDGPEADFLYDSVCPGYPMIFTDLSIPNSGYIVSWYWLFGDGDSSTLQNPTHIYQSAGNYTVSLTVTDGNGCTDLVQKSFNINEPVADFTYSPASPNPGDTVFFTDQSTSTNGYIIQWVWYFGDGDSTTVNFPDNPDVWHVYSDSGNFIVELHVIDNFNCPTYTNQNVLVFAGAPIFPLADFTYTLDCLNNPVLFTDLSTSNGGSPLQSWWWEFGDGGTSANQNPAYTYSSAGTYDVSLVVTNVDNLSDTVVKTVTTQALPLVSITAVSPNAQTGEAIQFYGTPINGTIVSWNWDFGDGNTAVTQNPVHTYLNQGNYTVTLTVVDTSGCTNSISMQVIIYSPPVFPEDSTIWNVVGDNSLTNQTWRFRYGLIGDTTIGTTDLDTSYIYSKVFDLYDSTLSNPNSTYFGALRTTEDKKVYVQLPGFEEALLYDFSLEVGDTIWYAIGGSLCYNSVVFTSEEHYKVVTATDSILIENGETRKRWSLTDYPNGMTDTWVDGIGSIVWYGLFNPLINNITLCGDGYSFACMKEGDEIVYLNNPHCEECFCQLMTALEENDVAEDDILHIYPNPANDHLIVESSEKIDVLRIIDMTGNIWLDARIDNNNTRISTMNLTNGVYIIEARSEDGFYKKKFVIYHP